MGSKLYGIEKMDRTIPTWRTVELGKYSNAEGYMQSIINQNQNIGRVARSIIPQVPLEKSLTLAELVKVASYDIDVSDENASITKVCETALENGLSLCHPEVVLALREQYPDQESPEILWVGTERILGRVFGSDHPGYFSVSHENCGQWLTFGCGGPSCWWGKMRRKSLKLEYQEKIVSMDLCECPWSRDNNPVYVIFERNYSFHQK